MADDQITSEEHVKEVYAQAGLALYFAQCFEMALANFLFFYHRATNERATVEELTAVEESNNKKTLGALLRRVKESCSFDEDAIDRLERALRDRNRLTHHFFKENAEGFLSTNGRDEMLRILSELQRSFQIADAMIEAANRAMVKAIGVPDEVIQEELRQMYARASNT